MQELVVEEMAAAVDALSREALGEAKKHVTVYRVYFRIQFNIA